MNGIVTKIFIAVQGAAAMQAVEEIEAIAECGLRGDRYASGNGTYGGSDECQVTLIESEDLEEIRTGGLHVENGEHRRNLVTRGIRLEGLHGKRFRIGEAVLEYKRPRPPCRHLESLTEPGMMKALAGCGGVCARVVKSGKIRANDPIVIL
ncbi:MAG: MOSC domain-containing protein [Acidobacteria bacterium]|nr:MOSC domain-containing protein [Acidobacteriota bacterium]